MLWMKGWLLRQPLGVMLLLALCWWGLYAQLEWMAEGVVSWLPVTPQTPLFMALSFFFYDVPKILLLLLFGLFGWQIALLYLGLGFCACACLWHGGHAFAQLAVAAGVCGLESDSVCLYRLLSCEEAV